jgi:predicted PhzF superfamily epimerase YddE/YHI9
MHHVFEEPVIVDIFTTITKIPFTGHPTIGSAWYILQHQQKCVQALQTKAGRIPIALNNGSSTLESLTISIFMLVPSPAALTT